MTQFILATHKIITLQQLSKKAWWSTTVLRSGNFQLNVCQRVDIPSCSFAMMQAHWSDKNKIICLG